MEPAVVASRSVNTVRVAHFMLEQLDAGLERYDGVRCYVRCDVHCDRHRDIRGNLLVVRFTRDLKPSIFVDFITHVPAISAIQL